MAPWQGPRHDSWASNTVLSGIALLVVLALVMITDYFGDPPAYLTGLLGVAGGTFFGAVGTDKAKREADVAREVEVAKEKVTHIAEDVEVVKTTAMKANETVVGLVGQVDEVKQKAESAQAQVEALSKVVPPVDDADPKSPQIFDGGGDSP